MYSENKEERIKQINDEKKREFIRFALTYFNSFGWKVEEDRTYCPEKLFAWSPIKEPYMIVPIVQSFEEYPTFKEIEELRGNLSHEILVISEEYGPQCPLKGNKKYKLEKHTASGIQFCYLKLKE